MLIFSFLTFTLTWYDSDNAGSYFYVEQIRETSRWNIWLEKLHKTTFTIIYPIMPFSSQQSSHTSYFISIIFLNLF